MEEEWGKIDLKLDELPAFQEEINVDEKEMSVKEKIC